MDAEGYEPQFQDDEPHDAGSDQATAAANALPAAPPPLDPVAQKLASQPPQVIAGLAASGRIPPVVARQAMQLKQSAAITSPVGQELAPNPYGPEPAGTTTIEG